MEILYLNTLESWNTFSSGLPVTSYSTGGSGVVRHSPLRFADGRICLERWYRSKGYLVATLKLQCLLNHAFNLRREACGFGVWGED
jgi:hypothetical protein